MTDPRTLWRDNLPLVRFTLDRMRAHGELQQPLDDDLLQEGCLALGVALTGWDPAKGALATYAVRCIRGAALDHLNTERNRGVGSRRQPVEVEPLPDEADGTGLSYALPPEGYADPSDAAEAAVLKAQLRYALDLLDDKDRQVLDALYGLTVEPLTLAEYGALVGLTGEAVRLRRGTAVRRLARLMGERL